MKRLNEFVGAAQAPFAGTAFFFSKEVPANGRGACLAATMNA